ncbi:MAG: DUF4286 family protein [Chitinophagales bacterium]|nr:DUF4286 family protein [Chitinophagales bacterium]
MIIYNTTFVVDLKEATDFIYEIKTTILLDLKSNKECQDAYFLELQNVDTQEHISYALQIHFDDLAAFNNYKLFKEPKFLEQITNKYGEKVLYFSTVLKEV